MNIHPHKFFKNVQYTHTSYPGIITEEITEFLQDIHPSQIIMGNITTVLYRVSFSYETKRGNISEGIKIVYLQEEHPDIHLQVQMMFEDQIEKDNKEKPFRAISNVKILEIAPIAKTHLSIG